MDHLPEFTEGSDGQRVEKVQNILHDLLALVDLLHHATLGEMLVPQVPFVNNAFTHVFHLALRDIDRTFPRGKNQFSRRWLVHGQTHAFQRRWNALELRARQTLAERRIPR